MKTEDIDKRIGMPDVDKEWARFEQEVIGKETKANKRSFYSWIGCFAIAASVVIVAGLFFLNHNSRETEQLLKETSKNSISHEVVSEPSSSEKPAEFIAKTSQPKKIKENRKGSTVTDYIYVSTATDNTFDCDEENAVFPGGEEALLTFIKANLKLPNLAIEYGAKGRIFTSFVIDSVGEVSDIRILERPQARISYDTPRLSQESEDTQVKIKELIALQLGEEATRILSLMPRWRPAIWGGKPTKIRYHLPIIFDATKAEQQKFLAKNLASESVNQALQERIAGLDIVPNSSYLGNGTTMRLRGTGDGPSDKDRIDSTLILVNGEPLPDSLKWQVFGKSIDDVDTNMPRYFSRQGLLIDSVYVHKDSKFTEKYGGLAKYGVIEITTVPGNQEELLAALPDFVPDENEVRLLPQGVIRGSHDSPPNDSILYLVNGVPQPKENNKWLDKRSYLDYFKGQHLLVSKVMRHMNEEAKQRYIEKYGEAAKHGVIEYICVEDTLCDYYMDQHEELKASRRRVSGIVYDENDEPLAHTMIYIWHDKRVWGFETTDSLGNFTFWVPRSDVKMEFTYVGFYKAVVVEPSDTFQTIYLLPNDNLNSLKESLKF